MTGAVSYPWRRNPEYSQSNMLSAEAPVFVPSWTEPGASSAPQRNCCLISLGAYSDDSDDSDSEVQSTTITPAATAAPVEAPATTDEQSSSMRPRRPWRVSAPEFVPRGLTNGAAESFDAGEGASAKVAPWRRSTPSPTTPMKKAERMDSSATFSTSEGSPSPTSSVDDASSVCTGSCASRSRSPTPPPPAQEEEEAGPLGLGALLRFRSFGSERSDLALPRAAEPEPGTTAAAIAAYASEAATRATGSSERRRRADTEDLSWRRNEDPDAESWRVKPGKLEVSDDSWVVQQTVRRRTKSIAGVTQSMSDEDIVRAMKSILNKLTVEKFESLSIQLINCGICNTFHLELLIQEVFDKATTQHHFIDMYADLCDLLNIHFAEHPINADDPKKNFKKVLLHCCQASFEKHLTPPKGLAELNSEDRAIAERKYKMQMLGNIKFVGALLVRKMLASKVMLAIMEELLQEPSGEALESLAALLTVVGPTFDTPDWAYRSTLNAIFTQVEKLTKKTSVDSRVRCLLKDVLDLRNSGWKDMRPKKIEGPLKLDQVAAKAAMETGGWMSQKASCGGNDWETVGKERLGKLASLVSGNLKTCSTSTTPMPNSARKKQEEASAPQKPEKTTKGTGAGAAMLEFLRNRTKPESPKDEPVQATKETAVFDKEECKKEIAATLSELRVSHDVQDAVARIADIGIPEADQPFEVDSLLASFAEDGTEVVRKLGFRLVAGLILDDHWKAEPAGKGVWTFIVETCPDLKFDVPDLPRIMREELQPALAPVVKAGKLEEKVQTALMKM